MVRRETKYYVGDLAGVHLEHGWVRIWGATSEETLAAPLDDLVELAEALCEFPDQGPSPQDPFDSQEFFHLMQRYRSADEGSPVAGAFDAVQRFCRVTLIMREKA